MESPVSKRYQIAYFTVNDPSDKRSWSGITYYIFKIFAKELGEVDLLGPVKIPFLLHYILIAIIKSIRLFTGKEYIAKHSSLVGIYSSYVLQKRMGKKKYDFIFAPAASTELSYLKTKIPIVFFSDATFNLMYKYYDKEYSNICDLTIFEGNKHERNSLMKSSLIIHASKWASNDASNFYGIDRNRLFSLTMGANMDTYPDANVIHKKFLNNNLTLLFLAVDWERKGGDIVYNAYKRLLLKFPSAELIICGCIPPIDIQEKGVITIPFINKNNSEDLFLFDQIMSKSHFLILPTRADCSLLVACEANAYGMPAISTFTGGVPDIIQNGVNGFCLDYNATADEYADIIENVYSDREEYLNLILSSRKRFETDLNWNVWLKKFKIILEKNLSFENGFKS